LRTRWFLGILIFLCLTTCCRKKESNTLSVGIINSLTGSAAPYGQNAQRGFELAKEGINDNGGIDGKKIDFIIEDDQTVPEKAVSAFRKLVDADHIPIIIGPLSSSSAMACAPLANETHTVLLSSGAATPKLTEAGDYVFRNRAPGQLEAIQIADFAYRELRLRSMFIFYINTDYGVGFKDVFTNEFEKLGGRIVSMDSYDQGETDFRPQITKMKGLRFDGIYILGVPIEVGYFLKQSAELNLRSRFLMNNMEDPTLIRIAGNAAEGIFFAIPFFNPEQTDEKVHQFVQEFRQKYGLNPDIFAADGYDAVYLVKTAIENGGYDGESIKNSLYKIRNWKGVDGVISFDKNGDAIKPLVIKTVRNGKFVIVSNGIHGE
jgi:branched-chain amino acid transport system substrate-binding protein